MSLNGGSGPEGETISNRIEYVQWADQRAGAQQNMIDEPGTVSELAGVTSPLPPGCQSACTPNSSRRVAPFPAALFARSFDLEVAPVTFDAGPLRPIFGRPLSSGRAKMRVLHFQSKPSNAKIPLQKRSFL